MYFIDNLSYLMKKFKYSQQYLGDKMGVGNTTVSAWLTGKAYPRIEVLLKLREEFKINLEDLFFKDLTANEGYKEVEPSKMLVHEKTTPYKKNTEGVGYEIVRIYENGTGIIETMQNDIEKLKIEIRNLQKRLDT